MKGCLLVLSNPISHDNTDDYNKWYDETHAKEVVALEGFRRIRRFKRSSAVTDNDATKDYKFLAIYDLDDIEIALTQLAKATGSMDLNGPIDLDHVTAIAFEEILDFEA